MFICTLEAKSYGACERPAPLKLQGLFTRLAAFGFTPGGAVFLRP
jgi:hypothetical protein